MKQFFAVLCMLTLASVAAATAFAEATPYASIRFSTFYESVDKNATGASDDSNDINFSVPTNTRLGFDFKVSDDVTGKVEVGTGINLRLAYGVWDFGPGALTVGQDYAPFDLGAGSVAFEDNDMYGFGALSIARSPQMTARLDNGLYVSLIKNPNNSVAADKVDFPILAVGFDGKIGTAAVGTGAGYATYEKQGTSTTDDAATWFVYVQAEQPVGKVSVFGKLYYGQNLGEIGAAPGNFEAGTNNAVYNVDADQNATTYAGFISVAGSINDKVGFTAGIGYLNTDTGLAGASDDDQMCYFVDMPVQIAKGFMVVPTVTYYDYMDDAAGNDEGSHTFVGAKWQFDL